MTSDDKHHKHEHSDRRSWFRRIYEDHYKALMIIPIIIIILSIAQIGYQISTTGDFAQKSVSLKGGITLTVPEESVNIEELDLFIESKFPRSDINVRAISHTKGFIVEASDVASDDLISAVEEHTGDLDRDEYSVEQIGSALGDSFFREAIKAIIIAFLFMGLVVFIAFRTFVPSVAVIAAALSDIIVTLAIFNLLGMRLSTAGIAAFLMLIGYSVDTDILLTTRVIKRKEGSVMSRIYSAVKTGTTTTFTTMSAVTVALLVTKSETIAQIMAIILIGLIVDYIMTWIQNVGMLRMYVDKKAKKHES